MSENQSVALIRQWFELGMTSGSSAAARVLAAGIFADDFTGTHSGMFAGVPPTGRRIRHTENEIYRIENGRVAESWGEGDWLGTLRQLGALPTATLTGEVGGTAENTAADHGVLDAIGGRIND